MGLKRFIPFIILGAALLVSAALAGDTRAQRPAPQKLADLDYPIQELGGCTSPENCATYCDSPKNLAACVAYAKKNRLMDEEEIEKAERFVAAGGTGPGGCGSEGECKTYCDDITNIAACVEFGEKSGLLTGRELEEAKKVKAALDRGAKLPGNCRNKDACEAYCQPADAGLMASRMEECIAFAKDAGFMSEEELAEVDKVLEAVKKGAKPPPCRGKKECDAYCGEEKNFEQCIAFAEAAGFINPQQAKMARLTGGKGPGGCKRDECETFCDDERNQEACANFMTELLEKNPDLNIEDFIPEQDRARMQEGLGQMQDALAEAPDEVKTCINETFPRIAEKIASGNFGPKDMMKIGPRMRPVMEKCFQGAFGGGPGGPGGGGAFPEEAKQCLVDVFGVSDMSELKKPPTRDQEARLRACVEERMGGPGGEGGGGFGPPGREFRGPGGCSSPEECQAYCLENPGACQGFGPPGADRPAPFGPEGEFPGEPGEFPGTPGEFPGGPPEGFGMPPEDADDMMRQFQNQPPTQEEIKRLQQQMQQQGGPPPEGFSPPLGPGGFRTPLNPPSLLGFFGQVFTELLR